MSTLHLTPSGDPQSPIGWCNEKGDCEGREGRGRKPEGGEGKEAKEGRKEGGREREGRR